MKPSLVIVASIMGLSVGSSIHAADLVGIWIAPPPNAFYYPGQKLADYPNSNSVTARYIFRRQNGALHGTYTGVDGTLRPLNVVKLNKQTLSLEMHSADGIVRSHARLGKDTLQLTSSVKQFSWKLSYSRATKQDLKIIAAEPVYSYKKLPLPPLHDVSGDNLAPTPPMGIGNFTPTSDAEVRKKADQMIALGLRDAGYVYIQIDEGWQGRRDAEGNIHPNAKFPDMKALADYVHSKGMKLGIYSSPGPAACWGYAGSHGHEQQDANTYAKWGIDYLKYDWCSAGLIYRTREEMQAVYQKMGEALRSTGRPIVYALCQYGMNDVSSWGRKVGANLWRTTGDAFVAWKTVSANGFDGNGKLTHDGPDGWNDPDDLQTGIKGMTIAEQRAQMTLWSIMAAPLLVEQNNNDLATWTPEIVDILTNREVIAVDQDILGKQGQRAFRQGSIEAWEKPLSDGSTAVALFNRGEAEQMVRIAWNELGIRNVRSVRDLWRKSDLGSLPKGYEGAVPVHGAVLLKVAAISGGAG